MTPADILAQVAAEGGYTVADLIGPRRWHRLCQARHRAMRCIRDECGLSTYEIGDLFERDHKTVMYGISQAQARLKLADAPRPLS